MLSQWKQMLHTNHQVVRFFRFLSVRQKKLEEIIEIWKEIDSQKQKLMELCQTRLVERHDALGRLLTHVHLTQNYQTLGRLEQQIFRY